MEDEELLRRMVEHYFQLGYENKVILDFLNCQHDIKISLSTLKRRLNDYCLKRRRTVIEEHDLRELVQREISGPGSLRGYRAIWHALRLNHHIHVPRRRVADILRELDPEGTRERRSRRLRRRTYTSFGPNFCWHVDGYDKLKPYGFPIHGAIDGYSRKIMWLEVGKSNNNPKVTGRFYFECVKENAGCPLILRSDCGSENGVMATMQSFFRQDGEDEFAAERAHIYGTSPSNQRIEGWWSFLRRGRTHWWIDHFKEMINTALLDIGSKLHTECLWFCYHAVLQADLDQVKLHWNTHRIRHSRHGTLPGVPDVLYYLPHRSVGMDCKVPITMEKTNEMEQHVADYDECYSDYNFYQEYFHFVMENEHLEYPNNSFKAYELFQRLIAIASQ